MESVARTRHVRISPQKLRLVCELIVGKKIDLALSVLEFTPKRSAKVVSKTLLAAVANARDQQNVDEDRSVRQTRDRRYRADLETVARARAHAFDADPQAHQPSDGGGRRARLVGSPMGQKSHPRGLRLGIIEGWDSKWYAVAQLRGAAARGFEAARLYQAAALPCRHLADRDRADGQQGQDQYPYGASRNRDRQEGRGDRQAQGRHPEADEGQGGVHQYS